MKMTRGMVCALVVPLFASVGCQSPSGEMADMQMPARPAELDRLSKYIGNWKATMNVTMIGSDKPVESVGTNTISWGAGNRCLVENFKADMGEGQTMEGLGIWVWDPKARKYRNYWFDNWGGVGQGTVTYNEESGVWHLHARSNNAYMGAGTVGEGTTKFLDDNTMKWTWTEWAPWTFRLVKIMEMEGTSVRQ